MKEKILAELRKKYAGLPVQFLGLMADKLAAKVTEESAIEGAIGELENLPISITDMAAEFQKEGDRRATEAANKRESTLKEKYNLVEKKPTEPTNPDPAKPPTDPAPANPELTELKNMLLELKQERDAQKANEAKQALFGKLKSKAAEKKIPETFLAGRVVEKEEDIDTVFAQVETDYNAAKQHFINQGMSENSIPLDGTGAAGSTNVSSLMKDYLTTKQKQEQK